MPIFKKSVPACLPREDHFMAVTIASTTEGKNKQSTEATLLLRVIVLGPFSTSPFLMPGTRCSARDAGQCVGGDESKLWFIWFRMFSTNLNMFHFKTNMKCKSFFLDLLILLITNLMLALAFTTLSYTTTDGQGVQFNECSVAVDKLFSNKWIARYSINSQGPSKGAPSAAQLHDCTLDWLHLDHWLDSVYVCGGRGMCVWERERARERENGLKHLHFPLLSRVWYHTVSRVWSPNMWDFISEAV